MSEDEQKTTYLPFVFQGENGSDVESQLESYVSEFKERFGVNIEETNDREYKVFLFEGDSPEGTTPASFGSSYDEALEAALNTYDISRDELDTLNQRVELTVEYVAKGEDAEEIEKASPPAGEYKGCGYDTDIMEL